MEVHPELYDFIKENEVHLRVNRIAKEINVYLFIYNCRIEKFMRIVGYEYFDSENEVSVVLQDGCIVIDIYDIIVDWFEHEVSDYRNCFDLKEWAEHSYLILESEAD